MMRQPSIACRAQLEEMRGFDLIGIVIRLKSIRSLLLMIVAILSAGCHRWEHVGGGWYVRHTEHLPEAGGSQPYLFRGTAVKKVPVLEFTHVYRYYGDDCIGFAAARGNYFACGDREPILLDVPGYPALHNLSFEPDGAKTRPLVPEAGPALVFPAAMLKAQAMRRKPQSQYDFTTIDANGRIVGRTGGGP